MITVVIRALVVDDDALARQRLRAMAAAHADLSVVGECGDGREAVEAIHRGEVDLVFLDVEMPRLDGFGVVAEVGEAGMPPVIFTSAYSQFAVRAFEAFALDYLLKPFDDERFGVAVARARDRVAECHARRNDGQTAAALDARLTGLLEHLGSADAASYPAALAIRTGTQYVVVRVADIDWLEADGNYARVYVQQRPRLLMRTLAALERDVLDPAVFVRVHRSAIVNTTKIAAAEPRAHGEMTLILLDDTRVECSRRYRKNLDEKLYFTT